MKQQQQQLLLTPPNESVRHQAAQAIHAAPLCCTRPPKAFTAST